MYNTHYECRYYKDDIFLDTDHLTDDEKDFVRNTLYREDLLNIFSLDMDTEFDNFCSFITSLYQKLIPCSKLREYMKQISAKMICEDEELGLCLLYSYDHMHLTHKCVSAYLENGEIPEKDLENLQNSIESS